MKKIIILFVAVVGLALTACAEKKTGNVETMTNNGENKKALVVYFSATGSTAKVAKEIASAVSADVYEIQPEVPYTSADLDWTDKSSRSVEEMVNNPNSRPAIKPYTGDLSQYDVVFIGYPIWWGIAPTIVNTWIESVDLSGKKVVPFATAYSSPGEPSYDKLKEQYPAFNYGNGYLSKRGNTKGLAEWASGEVKK